MSSLIEEWKKAQERLIDDFYIFLDGAVKEYPISDEVFITALKSALNIIYPSQEALAERLSSNRQTLLRWLNQAQLPAPIGRLGAITLIKEDVQNIQAKRGPQP